MYVNKSNVGLREGRGGNEEFRVGQWEWEEELRGQVAVVGGEEDQVLS